MALIVVQLWGLAQACIHGSSGLNTTIHRSEFLQHMLIFHLTSAGEVLTGISSRPRALALTSNQSSIFLLPCIKKKYN